MRFLNSWEVCNDANFAEASNTALFLRGDSPNWGTIDRSQCLTRDITADIYDGLLDYVTQKGHARVTNAVLGSAGYGVSTLLMQIAHRLVKDHATNVFKLRRGRELLEADVLFIAQSFPDARPIFIIDDAAELKARVRTVIQLLSQNKASAAFVLGARLNEWHTARGHISAQEYLIEPLSDGEIVGLLELLEQTNELGELRPLDPELRFAAVKSRHSKELLVTLREVTEGRQFDAIIDDEYRKIENANARRLYNLVCALYQEGQYLRDSVAARVLQLDTTELFAQTNAALYGVVFHDEIDSANGIYAFRARHRVIARIVWRRCMSGDEREEALLQTMRSLNLTFRTDRQAFDALVQSDELVDSLPTLEAKVRYFEEASRNDPASAYVRQHFARMYLRAGHLTSALTQINHALDQDSGIRSLHHTRGLILAHLANEAPAVEVARKYLTQAEDEFRYCISQEPRDAYAHQSLAELYRRWAEREVVGDDEATSYYRRAEEVISEGLKRTNVHDRLHVESSRIAESLGNQPERMRALKRAVESENASIYARYLLGRALRQAGDYSKAIEVLRPILIEDFNAFRSAIELAISTVSLSGDFAQGASILVQAELLGIDDGRFIATLGGMQFLARNLDAARKTFAAGRKLPAEEQRAVYFKPVVQIGALPFGPVELSGDSCHSWIRVRVCAGHRLFRYASPNVAHREPQAKGRRSGFIHDRVQSDGPFGRHRRHSGPLNNEGVIRCWRIRLTGPRLELLGQVRPRAAKPPSYRYARDEAWRGRRPR